jgi:hypothetical protein
MLLVSFWSAGAIHRVNRQLATLSEATLPLTLAIQDLRSTALNEYIVLQQHHLAGGNDQGCQAAFARHATVAQNRLRRAQASIVRGIELAITERNKLELARMQPLIGELAATHERYVGSASRFCAALPGGARRDARQPRPDRHRQRGGAVPGLSRLARPDPPDRAAARGHARR